MIYLVFYVPITHAENVKDAVFKAGAGRFGQYEMCSWETRGVGQFKPLQGSKAFLGKVGTLEKVEELKVELYCPESRLNEVIQALKASHPYETPAFFAMKALDIEN